MQQRPPVFVDTPRILRLFCHKRTHLGFDQDNLPKYAHGYMHNTRNKSMRSKSRGTRIIKNVTDETHSI